MPPLTGGVTAPTNIGLGQAAAPRAGRRAKRPVRGYDRQKKIMDAIARSRGRIEAPQRGMGPLPIEPGQGKLPGGVGPAQGMERAARARMMDGAAPGGGRLGQARKVPGAPAPGIGGAERPGLGKQLSRLVASGDISEGRARKTKGERSSLREAFGADWRDQIGKAKVGGEEMGFRELREALAGDQAGNPEMAAAYQQLVADRLAAVEEARKTLKRRRRGGRQVGTAEVA